jgi:hypothetical protein
MTMRLQTAIQTALVTAGKTEARIQKDRLREIGHELERQKKTLQAIGEVANLLKTMKGRGTVNVPLSYTIERLEEAMNDPASVLERKDQ